MPYRLQCGNDQFRVTQIYAAHKSLIVFQIYVKYIFYVNPHYRYSSMHWFLPPTPLIFFNWAQECTSMSLLHDLLEQIPLPQITSPLTPVWAHHE